MLTAKMVFISFFVGGNAQTWGNAIIVALFCPFSSPSIKLTMSVQTLPLTDLYNKTNVSFSK